jgi:(2Fe-2S) ferredoxin/ubiquinone/menaquinone biosynthesis C-methylase UbiE
MEPFRYHVFVCTQEKPEGVPCCAASGSAAVLDALRTELGARGLADEVQVSSSGCLGTCDHGPVMIAYPEGAWYSELKAADVAEIVASHFDRGQPVSRRARSDAQAMKAEILDHRNHYLAMLKAKDAAGMLPDEVQETIRGFMSSRAILTAIELDLFTAVGGGASAAQVAGRIKTDARSTELLMNALVALQLLQKSGDGFQNTPLSRRFFTAGSPDNARPAQMHTVNLWKRWSTLTEAVRAGTRVADRGANEEWTGAFIAAMDHNARGRAEGVVKAVGVTGARRMLDLGGGSGAYSIAFAKAVPQLRGEILDLPDVLPIAQEHLRRAGVADRISTRAGDMLQASLGKDVDLVLLSAICHMFSVEENRGLLQRIYQALAPGGRVVVQDFILEEDKTSPKFGALFALNMLVGTKAGASYSEPEYTEWMRAAGFREIKRVRLPGPSGLMIGTK